MTRDQKRKYRDYSQETQYSDGVGRWLAESKKSSVQAASLSAALNSQMDPQGESQQESIELPCDYGEWQMVGRSSKLKPKQKGARNEKDQIQYPELACHGKVTAPISIADLQALILYTLADGIAPSWIAFKHALHIRKVVVLMVPGLEMSMFDGTIPLENESSISPKHGPFLDGQESSRLRSSPGYENGFHVSKNGSIGTSLWQGNPTKITAESLPPALQPLAEIFDSIWSVRAPGDNRYARLLSPIQAMLTSPLPQSKKDKVIRGPKPPAEERDWLPQRTAITEFIHTPDELREALYPLHPASIRGESTGASLEQERRDKKVQNAEGGWVDTRVSCSDCVFPSTSVEKEGITGSRTVYAVDCEMVLTSDDKHSLARISVVDWNGTTVLDELVKPSLPIKNYFTQFSGMTAAIIDPVQTTLSDVQSQLLDLFTPQSILLGHSLESDLTAIKLTHPFIIDTSLIYPHPRGFPLRSSLKFLAQKYLRRPIQQQGSKGHDSVEDALAVLDLVKLKCEKGQKWGSSEARGEPIFRRLARNKRKDAGGNERVLTSAVIDYGTPERVYGKEANVQIGCQSDVEVADAVVRAVNGDADGKSAPGGGVDFTWARLRELESLQGWCNNNPEYYSAVDKLNQLPLREASVSELVANGGDNAPESLSKQAQRNGAMETLSTNPDFRSTIASTVSHLHRIYDNMPPCTLFIVYTGTGDPREVSRLQKMQQQFRKEFNTKRWDDLSVKWTDDEEQALKKAVERAREGLGFICVK